MLRKVLTGLTVSWLIAVSVFSFSMNEVSMAQVQIKEEMNSLNTVISEQETEIDALKEELESYLKKSVKEAPTVGAAKEVVEDAKEKVQSLTKEEIDLIALVTMAEAEGESELGKRLVIDTILNRLDSERHPNTIHEVIYQKGQFTSMWGSRVTRCYVRDDIVQLVKEELVERTNSEVIYFRMTRYHSFGTPMFQEGCHYFSGY